MHVPHTVCFALQCSCFETICVIQIIVTKIPQHSFGIAVYGDYLYWTDWMLRAVLRANKYDGTGLTWLKKGIKRQPMGIIAVTNDTNDCE